MPQSHEIVVGVSNIRGDTVPIYDLSKGINKNYLKEKKKILLY